MKHNKPFLIILCSTALIILTPFVKADSETLEGITDKDRARHEATGVVGGAVIGGIVGGPIGAVVTAAFGNWVSEQTLAKKENTFLAKQLDNQRQELLAMQSEFRALQARHQVALRENQATKSRLDDLSQANTQMSVATVCCEDTEITLHFKTGSSRIEALYKDKLSEFASHASKYPKLEILVNGHADRRGDSEANMALSRARISEVVSTLQELGVTRNPMETSAYGEESPDSNEDTFENNFFDRRVVVKLIPATSALLTQAID